MVLGGVAARTRVRNPARTRPLAQRGVHASWDAGNGQAGSRASLLAEYWHEDDDRWLPEPSNERRCHEGAVSATGAASRRRSSSSWRSVRSPRCKAAGRRAGERENESCESISTPSPRLWPENGIGTFPPFKD
eukprot:206326-Chlamydomonas_euryale.AAC.3